MGKNKQVRKKVASHLRNIRRHEAKVEAELRKTAPDSGYIRKWKREIDIARRTVRKLEERLEK
jgi:predicted  nucleic acid-binding Zn-ribbon protein